MRKDIKAFAKVLTVRHFVNQFHGANAPILILIKKGLESFPFIIYNIILNPPLKTKPSVGAQISANWGFCIVPEYIV
jgi:hypothetical protein